MQTWNKITLTALLFAAASAGAQTSVGTPTPQWQSAGAAQYVCGGVSDEGMSAITEQRSSANSELLFTGGPEGVYLADVAVSVHGTRLQQPLTFTSNGPLCLLKLPAGSYTVEAAHKGRSLKQTIKTDGMLKQTKFNWPAG